MRVALLNAHTSYAQGASWTNGAGLVTEYIYSRKINEALQGLLVGEKNVSSYIVDGSEEKPYGKSLRYKAFFVGVTGADVVVETHFNSTEIMKGTAQGTEVLYDKNRDDSKELAIDMVDSVKKFLPFKIRRSDGLFPTQKVYILHAIDCPTVVLEVCFFSHSMDRLFMLHPRAHEVVANCIKHTLLTYGKRKGLLDG